MLPYDGILVKSTSATLIAILNSFNQALFSQKQRRSTFWITLIPPKLGVKFDYCTPNQAVLPRLSAMNKIECLLHDGQRICYQPTDVPFYHTDRLDIIPGIPDTTLALVAPVLAYWFLSLIFHVLDVSEWKWLDRYRIHESAEVKSRNLATRSQVVLAVIIQQVIQTILGYLWVDEKPLVTPAIRRQQMEFVGVWVIKFILTLFGKEMGCKLLQVKGSNLVYFIYWWGIPITQFVIAMCAIQLFFMRVD